MPLYFAANYKEYDRNKQSYENPPENNLRKKTQAGEAKEISY